MLSLIGSMAAQTASRNKQEYPAARFTGQQPVIPQKTAHQGGDSVHFSGSFMSRESNNDSVKINASDPNSSLSTYKLRPIVIDNQTWRSVEHYFQARKFMRSPTDVWDTEAVEKIKNAGLAEEAVAIADEHLENRDRAWRNKNRTGADVLNEDGSIQRLRGKMFQAMYFGLKELFDQDPSARQDLLATGEKKIQATRNQSETWGGQNNAYGKMLMRIRQDLAAAQLQAFSSARALRDIRIDQLVTAEEKLRFWQHIQDQLEFQPHSKVLINNTGNISVHERTDMENYNKPGLTPDANPLLSCAHNRGKHINRNTHFVVIVDKKWKAHKPHLLILPNPKAANNYRDMLDFLRHGTSDEKISLMNMMQEKMANNPTPVTSELFRANNGLRHDIPYLHVHYKPYNKS